LFGAGKKGGNMAKSVTVYSTPTCPFCIRAKQFLKDSNIEFTNFDVGSDQSKAQEMIKKSGQMGVPVIDIDGTIIVGFDKEKIKETLGI
jgi:glutaredoxin-like YruB-family protein